MEALISIAAGIGAISFIRNVVELTRDGKLAAVGAAILAIILGSLVALASSVALEITPNWGTIVLAGIAMGGNASNAHDVLQAVSRDGPPKTTRQAKPR